MRNTRIIQFVLALALIGMACTLVDQVTGPGPTPLPAVPVQPGDANPNEPVFITGTIPYTSRFFLASTAEPFVLLEDQAGFVFRDKEFEFSLVGQAIGPVEFTDQEQVLSYSLALPSIPQGTLLDVDNDDEADRGVQIFAVAYWSNTWGGPFLEPRDGFGWSGAHASTIIDIDRDNEIVGGTLVVWAPDDQQSFPSGFGEDGSLFTADDPVAPIPAGYNLVDINQKPFRIYKEAQPVMELVEGPGQVNDLSNLSYAEAFEALFNKVSVEYPFTVEKNVDWQALFDTFAPRVENAQDSESFYLAIRDFTLAIPDGHIGGLFNAAVFQQEAGGGFGLILAELSDERVIVRDVLPGTPAAQAGILVGAEILSWNNQAAGDAISQVKPIFGPYSTEHHKRQEQVVFLTRVPPGTEASISFQNPAASQPSEITLEADLEFDSLFQALLSFTRDELSLPVEARVLESGLGYISVQTFQDDYNLMARLWERAIQSLIDNQIPGLILDLRDNGGGSGGMALDFAGYFFEEEVILYKQSFYNAQTDQFEFLEIPARIKPGPLFYPGPLAVLVGTDCFSACEGFAYALSQTDRTTILGHHPSAGAYGSVGRGQYKLPDDLDLQFPTGRPETFAGEVVIEGMGVQPDIIVPITEESALGLVDTVLEVAVATLLGEIE
jgi:C-terminal processing protease CtpA/Prc